MATTITNGNIDSLASAVPAPFGPLTRVGSVSNLAPNSDYRIKFTSNVSTTEVFMSYDELNDADKRDLILLQAHAGRTLNSQMQLIKYAVEAIDVLFDGYGDVPFSDAEAQTVIELLRCIQPLTGMTFRHNDKADQRAIADFTVSDAGSHAADVTVAAVGDIELYVWNWGDGTYSTGSNPANHTYSGAGTKTITLTVIGPGGISWKTKSIAIA